MAEEKSEKLTEYVVREGKTFGIDAKQPGESVFLTEEQFKGFSDLLEPKVRGKKEEASEEDTRDTAKNEANIGTKKK